MPRGGFWGLRFQLREELSGSWLTPMIGSSFVMHTCIAVVMLKRSSYGIDQ